MNPKPKLIDQEYINTVRMSADKFLLVEGKNDKKFFGLLKYQFCPNITINIDTVENTPRFQDQDGRDIVGNRSKVVEISSRISTKVYAHRFVGFVDRENEGFDLDNLTDRLNCHKVDQRLVWSRGHSIENYFFDYLILKESLSGLSNVEYFDKAIVFFANYFEKVIRIACAMGLAASELQKFQPIRDSIHWETFELRGSDIFVNLTSWERSLLKKHLQDDMVSKIIASFNRWMAKVESTDFQIIRWLCDGHAGMSIIWSAYCFFVCKVTPNADKNKLSTEIYKVNEGLRYQNFADWCSRKALDGNCVYPTEVFYLLGINL